MITKRIVLTRSFKEPSQETTKRILVRCPTTSLLSPTGKIVKEALWDKTKLRLPKATCLHCGQIHIWTKKDVVLAR
jgi:hypothetical protein